MQFVESYFNTMQALANLADTNILIAEVGRGGGKTEGILGPRSIRVAHDMPGSLVVLGGPTYVSLMQNIVPNLLAYYRNTLPNGKTILTEGIHYVVGAKDLPKHFAKPIFPLVEPKHTISFVWGTTFRLVSADRPESAAGISASHGFFEEMKHIDGKNIRSRVFPAIRGKRNLWGHSHYFQGITGISDTARVDLGEDDWFTHYEKEMDHERIADIVAVALHINRAQYQMLQGIEIERNQRIIERWTHRIANMRKGTTTFLRYSSFVNRHILGLDYFKQQLKNMELDEFLSSIANIRPRKVNDMFFGQFNRKKHTFNDTYKYDIIDKYDLRQEFQITSADLKHCAQSKPLVAGFDPGFFMSFVVGQKKTNELRILKNFYQIHPNGQHKELAKDFADYFATHKEKTLYLYYDRAGNQRKYNNPYSGDLTDTDAMILQRELQALGWQVKLMSKDQRTIYFWEHYNLINILFSEKDKETDRIRICENQCQELINSIFVSPLKKTEGRIELDKSSEKEVPIKLQANNSTQIATSLLYLLFGLYEKYMPSGKAKERPDYDPQVI